MALDRKYGKLKIDGIPEDEPVFVLRAQDVLSAPIIARYRNMAQALEEDDKAPSAEWFANLDTVIETFSDWRVTNADKVKIPD